ncbi:MAG: TIGR04283 family arsenosugar biosynthesis glycosyltransferase [Gammaproteobacteria bacterium]|nr:TIGR04283 family arsenosugar biosynthesis glycosyltransferase [Gammaproteobacteria bacterium]
MSAPTTVPRLSIIIPTLDEAVAIDRLLDDLTPFRAGGHELILVDGGSTDGTIDRAAGRVDVHLTAPAGRAAQMNHAAARARGDVLWFVHADSRIPAGADTAVVSAIQDGAVWGRFDVRLSGTGRTLRVVEFLMNLRSRISGIATGDQGIFVERSLFTRLGGFGRMPLMEDIDLSRRLRRHAPPACLRRPRLTTSSRRWERDGVARTVLLMWRLRLAFALGTPAERLARLYR